MSDNSKQSQRKTRINLTKSNESELTDVLLEALIEQTEALTQIKSALDTVDSNLKELRNKTENLLQRCVACSVQRTNIQGICTTIITKIEEVYRSFGTKPRNNGFSSRLFTVFLIILALAILILAGAKVPELIDLLKISK